MSFQNDIYTGFWIDHSKGPVLGATITLESKWGTLVTSAATLAVTFIGASIWTIVAFALHQWRSSEQTRDEFDAQIQVLLRNSEAPDATLLALLGSSGVGRTWHEHKAGAWQKCLTIAVAPALIWIGFLVAGIFVGRIATSEGERNHVLLRQGSCGWIDRADPDSLASSQGLSHINVNTSTVSMQYARQCYQTGQLSAISCATFPKPRLHYDIKRNQPCPVPGEGACFTAEDSAAMTMTTSKVDSHKDLGINAPPANRLTIEKSATCAPMAYDFVDTFLRNNSQAESPYQENNITVEEYHFGEWAQSDLNSSFLFQYTPAVRWLGLNAVEYGIASFRSLFPHKSLYYGWLPATPLDKATGDLSLIIVLPNSVSFTGPVQDVMFRTGADPDPYLLGGAPYRPFRNAYVLTCAEQHQICNPANDRCTGFVPAVKLLPGLSSLDINADQNATATRLITAALTSSIQEAVYGVSDPLVASSYRTSQTISQPVPDNQWQLEVEGWFQAALSKIQLLQSVWVDVPGLYVEANNVKVVSPDSEALNRQCGQQRVAAPQKFQNYNFFALMLIAILSLVVPAISHLLRHFPRFLAAFAVDGHRTASWQAESTLQLHRMAMEGAGYRDWDNCAAEVPRTKVAVARLPQAELVHASGGQLAVQYPQSPDHDQIQEVQPVDPKPKSFS